MRAAPAEDTRLSRLTKICLALPEATREIAGRHAIFRVRAKTFAYFQDNHHGDGIVSLVCKVLPGDNTSLVSADPKRFLLPAYLAAKGWVALRLDAGRIDWEEVAGLVTGSYRLIAPRVLSRRSRT